MAEPIRYFFDQHIPVPSQMAFLRGIDVLAAQDAGRCGLSDTEQLQRAVAEGRVLVSLTGFSRIGRERNAACWNRVVSSHEILNWAVHRLVLVHAVLDSDEMKNSVEYL